MSVVSLGSNSGNPLDVSRNQKENLPSSDKLNWLLHLHFARKEYDACRELIKHLLEISSGTSEYAHFVQGCMLRQEGKVQEALEAFQTCNIINAANANNVMEIGKCLLLTGRHRRAYEAFKQADSLDSNNWEILHYMATSLYRMKQYDLAKEHLQTVIRLFPYKESFLMLAKIHLAQNDSKNAIEMYRLAIQHHPDCPDLRVKVGILYLQEHNPDKAFEQLGTALSLDSTNPRAVIAVGAVLQSHGDFEVAMTRYKGALNVSPHSSRLWNNMGLCFLTKQKHVAALTCLQHARALDPLDYKVTYNLGLAHLSLQQYASAFNCLSCTAALNPRQAQPLCLLGVTLAQLEDPTNARRAFTEALSLDSNDPVIHLNFALFLWATANEKEASEEMSKFWQHSSKFSSEVLSVGQRLSERLKASVPKPADNVETTDPATQNRKVES